MDFWAQHKDFILKVLAGLGVFLVALLARSITYGDELETAQAKNEQLARKIEGMRIAPLPQIQAVEGDAARLEENARAIASQVGWDVRDAALEARLLERILRYTRRFSRADDATVARAASDFRGALREDVNGGFGQLRLMVRQEMVEEASEKNIRVGEGIGFDQVTEIASDELLQYLMQLELVARIARYAIDAGADAIQEVRITAKQRDEVIPGANPEFLREYPVTVAFSASQEAVVRILNRLDAAAEGPRVPVTGIEVKRLDRPKDHLGVTLTVRATAANPDVAFALEQKGE